MVPCGHLHQTEEPLERVVEVVLWWEGRWEGVIVSVRKGEEEHQTMFPTSKSTANSFTLVSSF